MGEQREGQAGSFILQLHSNAAEREAGEGGQEVTMKLNKIISPILGIFTALPWRVGFLSRSAPNDENEGSNDDGDDYVVIHGPCGLDLVQGGPELLQNLGTWLIVQYAAPARMSWREAKRKAKRI